MRRKLASEYIILKDKVIIITGVSSGIGKAIANLYAEQGAQLVLASRNLEELNKIASALQEKTSKILVVKTDISISQDCKMLVDKTLSHYGRIDLLVNNAGISQRSLTMDTKMEVYRTIMEVNYFGTIELSKLVLDSMINNGGGQLAVISSVVGKFGFPFRSGYAASKHALHGFFDSLRAEVSDKKIDITIICPGRVQTNVSLNAMTEDGSKHNKMDKGTAEGMSVEKCAKLIVQAIAAKKKEVIIAGKEKYLVWLRKFIPSLYYKLAASVKSV